MRPGSTSQSRRLRSPGFPLALIVVSALMALLTQMGGQWTPAFGNGSPQISAAPPSGAEGDPITISGSSWIPGVPVNLAWDNPSFTITSVTPDINGDFPAGTTIDIPFGSAVGNHTLTATQTIGGGTGTGTGTGTGGGGTLTADTTIEVTFGAAHHLEFVKNPSGGQQGVVWSDSPMVAVHDAADNTITNDNTTQVELVIDTAVSTTATATLTCNQNPMTAFQGVAIFTGCQIDMPGNYVLIAKVFPANPNIADAYSVDFSVGGDADSISILLGDGQGGDPGEVLEEDLVVGVFDAANRPLPGVTVTFTVTQGGGTLEDLDSNTGSTLQVVTDETGAASVALTLSGAPGPNQHLVTATCACDTTNQVTFTANVFSHLALQIVRGDEQTGVTGQQLARRLRVQVVDLATNTFVQGIPVTFSVTDTPTGGETASLETPGPTNSDSTGQVATRFTLGNAEGEYLVTASCADCESGDDEVEFLAFAVQGHNVTGTVVGQFLDGTPIGNLENARVVLSQPEYGLRVSTTTNASGQFTLQMAEGSATLNISLQGYGTVETGVGMDDDGNQDPPASDLRITLINPGVQIQGKVTRNSVPQANVLVKGVRVGGSGLVTTLTNASGDYTLAVAPNTQWNVSAIASFGTAFVDLNPANNVIDVITAPAVGNIAGQNITFPATVTVSGTVKLDNELIPSTRGSLVAQAVGTAPAPGAAQLGIGGAGQFSLTLPVPPGGSGPYFFTLTPLVDGMELIPRLIGVNSSSQCVDRNGSVITCERSFNQYTRTITFEFRNNADALVTVRGATVSASGTTQFTGTASGTVTVEAPSNSLTIGSANSATLKAPAIGTVSNTSSQSYTLAAAVNGVGPVTPETATVTIGTTQGDATTKVRVPTRYTLRGTVTEQIGNTTPASLGATVQVIARNSGGTTVFMGGTVTTPPSAANGNFAGGYVIEVPDTATTAAITVTKSGFTQGSATVSVGGNPATPIQVTNINLQTPARKITGTVPVPDAGHSDGVIVTAIRVSPNDGLTVSNQRGTAMGGCTVADLDAAAGSAANRPIAFCLPVQDGTWQLSASTNGYQFSGSNQGSNQVVVNGADFTGVQLNMTQLNVSPPVTRICIEASGCSVHGVFPVQDGTATIGLVVPAGAVGTTTAPISVSVGVTTNVPRSGTLEAAFRAASGLPFGIDLQVHRLDTTNNTRELITDFNLPVIFNIHSPFAAGVANVGFYNEGSGNWVIFDGCTGTGNRRSCPTEHLTKFTVLSAKTTTTTTTGGGGGSSSGSIPPLVTPGGGAVGSSGSFAAGSGGTVASSPVTVTVPGGLFAGQTGNYSVSVTVNPANAPLAVGIPTPSGAVLTNIGFEVTLRDPAGNIVHTPTQPVPVTIQLTADQIAAVGGDLSQLQLLRYDEESKTWVSAGAVTVGANGTSIIVMVDHFSTFALVVKAVSPTLASPAANAVIIGFDPSLTWSQPAATKQFQVQVVPFNNDGPGINMIIGREDLVRLARYNIAPPVMGQGNYILLPGMSYTWRVRTSPASTSLAEDAVEWSDWSEARSFRTGSATSATIRPLGPVDNGPIASRTPTLAWSNLNERIFYYEVQLSTDPNFEVDPAKATAAVYWNLVHGGETNPLNSWTVPASAELEANSTYYWRVRPRVQGDGTPVTWSDTWRFRTP